MLWCMPLEMERTSEGGALELFFERRPVTDGAKLYLVVDLELPRPVTSGEVAVYDY